MDDNFQTIGEAANRVVDRLKDRVIIVEKLDSPIRFTGHHLFHYRAFYQDDPSGVAYGQVENEARLTLVNRERTER
jgi:hypothetical protein